MESQVSHIKEGDTALYLVSFSTYSTAFFPRLKTHHCSFRKKFKMVYDYPDEMDSDYYDF